MSKKSEKKKDVALTKAQLQESVSKPLRFQDGEDGRVKQVTPPEEAAPATVQMTGVRDSAGITRRFLSEVAAVWAGSGESATAADVNSIAVLLHDIAPRDAVEGLLAVEMVATHSAAMQCLTAAMSGNQTLEAAGTYINLATKLMRTYTAQIEALNKHRNKARQTVIVKHVHVHEGGQAIVGNVAQGEGGGGRG